MTRRLFQIVYRSKALELPPVESITSVSLRNNNRDSVFGLLVCDQMRYFQAIEGDEGLVKACMARISTDKRHGNVEVVSSKSVLLPSFKRFEVLCNLNKRYERKQYVSLIESHVRDVKDPALQAMFIGFGFMAALHRNGHSPR